MQGIRTIEYGVIGEVLFWSLQKILGDAYTRRVEEAWTKVFSSMLRIIVPIAVAFERDEGRFKRAAVTRAQAMSTFRNSAMGRTGRHAGMDAAALALAAPVLKSRSFVSSFRDICLGRENV